MTEAALKYKLECYKKIEVLNEKGNLWLIKPKIPTNYTQVTM